MVPFSTPTGISYCAEDCIAHSNNHKEIFNLSKPKDISFLLKISYAGK